ncbi:MAG: TlpA family protein disulfide reductase [Chromatiaceae bacterium]|nr:TlpA family protein disulfide reductase [Chromatiaceae bacterium]MBP6806889.1 TlpA family protein disulfide reductase [Chromatiaceae bacterium]MBP8288397.1 TlpA family protein disulfide reductase [Chromatiaceae bacterium]MBP9602810.1 TlpA family protein disulfide reductase [Chromatiaceae bacterium]
MPNIRPLMILGLVLAVSLALPCWAGELRPLEARTAPALELPDLGGAMHRLADWRDQVILLNFWASWCQPCVAEMPGIQRLEGQMRGRGFVVVGVNVAEAQRRATRSVEQMGLGFPVLLDAEGETFHAWGGKALPTSALIDRQGRLRYVGLGPLEWDGAEALGRVESLLKEPVSAGDGG